MKRIALVLVPLTIFLVGCGTNDGYDDGLPHVPRTGSFVVVVEGDADKTIFEFTTPDGMPCLQNYDGALTCDWDWQDIN